MKSCHLQQHGMTSRALCYVCVYKLRKGEVGGRPGEARVWDVGHAGSPAAPWDCALRGEPTSYLPGWNPIAVCPVRCCC